MWTNLIFQIYGLDIFLFEKLMNSLLYLQGFTKKIELQKNID